MYPSSAVLGKINASIILPSLARTVNKLYIGCETVCANESRAELVPAMPSAAKLGALVHKFPYRDAFSINVSGGTITISKHQGISSFWGIPFLVN